MVEIAVLVLFVSIVLLVLGLLWKDENPMEARMAAMLGERVAPSSVSRLEGSIGTRLLGPMAQALAGKLTAILPTTLIGAIQRQLVQAGQPVTLGGFLVAVFVCEATMLTLGAMLLLASGSPGGQQVLLFGLMAVMGLFLPRLWLSNRVLHRQKEILKSLPDAFDLITTCVEAGLGLDAALAKVSEKVEGPFAEELQMSLREVSLGKLRRDALKEMGDRTGVPDLASFINAVVQAETMGTSIATVLRVQAEQMRTRRRQRAEQQAYQAPVKMIFPLVLCIFPTLFIVILGPAAITLYENLIVARGG